MKNNTRLKDSSKTRMSPRLFLILMADCMLSASLLTDRLNIRLVDGNNSCSGRVEILYDGKWGTVCDDYWDANDVAVVCRQLDCGKAISPVFSAQFGEGSGSIWLDDVNCSGKENDITQCKYSEKHNCGHNEDAGVVCSGPEVRLVNSSSTCCGRVEIHHSGRWGTVCDDSWDLKDADVVCRQVGCGRAVSAPHNAHFGRGNKTIWLDNVACTGAESALHHCSYLGFGVKKCGHGEDAGVVCSRMPTPTLTRVSTDSAVSPGELLEFRCSTPSPTCIPVDFSLYKYGRFIKNQTAQSTATFSLTADASDQGQYTCDYSYRESKSTSPRSSSITITVGREVRLVNGSSTCCGRVEIRHSGRWGTVCDDSWDLKDADVVCRQLECGQAISAPHNAHFGQGGEPTWLDDVQCTGTESALDHCSHKGFGAKDCGPAGVMCSKMQIPTLTRVSPDSVLTPGEVLQFMCSTPSPTCISADFNLYKFRTLLKNQTAESTATFTLTADASHHGQYTCDYSYRESDATSPRSSSITITVVNLPQPNISFSAGDGLPQYGYNRPEITKGYSFSIICFTESQYPGGSFHLKLNSSNITRTQSAVNQSADFLFPEAKFIHQGTYSCTYEVNVSSRTFTSTTTEHLWISEKASVAPFIGLGSIAGLLLMLLPCIKWVVRTLKRQKCERDIHQMWDGKNTSECLQEENRTCATPYYEITETIFNQNETA